MRIVTALPAIVVAVALLAGAIWYFVSKERDKAKRRHEYDAVATLFLAWLRKVATDDQPTKNYAYQRARTVYGNALRDVSDLEHFREITQSLEYRTALLGRFEEVRSQNVTPAQSDYLLHGRL